MTQFSTRGRGRPIRFWRPLAIAAALFAVASAPTAFADTTVRVGVIGASSDAAFFIARAKGYFRDEGVDADIVHFKNSGQMVAPLGSGDLQVGAGAPSAGLYNAVARGIDVRMVADKGSMPPGYGFMPLMVRKDLVDSQKFKSLKDLKGLKVGSQTTGGAATATLNAALEKAGLKITDVDVVYMGHPELALAIENGAIAAAFITEPNATNALRSGKAVRFLRGDEVYPNQQLSVVLYSGQFAKTNPDVARRFMRAYIRASRDYNDALKDGKLAGPNADEIISILTKETDIKDPAIYRAMIPHGSNPNGELNIDSLKKDFEFFRSEGLIKGQVTVEQTVDESFAKAAVEALGPYKPKS